MPLNIKSYNCFKGKILTLLALGKIFGRVVCLIPESAK